MRAHFPGKLKLVGKTILALANKFVGFAGPSGVDPGFQPRPKELEKVLQECRVEGNIFADRVGKQTRCRGLSIGTGNQFAD